MNEHELAEYLETGRLPGGAAARPDSDAGSGSVRDLLGDDDVWAEPAPGGLDDLLAAIQAESGPRPAPPSQAPEAGPPRDARRVPGRPSRRRWAVAVAAAAAAVVVAAGVAGLVLRAAGDGAEGHEVALSATELAPEASGTATVTETGSGIAISLDVDGLPPAEPGTYYQGWVKGPEGVVTVGTFHMREGDEPVELWAGVDLDRYPTLTVTLQEEGAGQESSGQVVLTAEIGS